MKYNPVSKNLFLAYIIILQEHMQELMFSWKYLEIPVQLCAVQFQCILLIKKFWLTSSSQRRCSIERLFSKISQYSQESNNVGVSFSNLQCLSCGRRVIINYHLFVGFIYKVMQRHYFRGNRKTFSCYHFFLVFMCY